MITDINQLDLNGTYTYADYLAWKFQERLELIKGKVFKMSPAPSRLHQKISSNLHLVLGSYFRKKKCEVYSAPFDVRLPIKKGNKTYTVVQPDLCVICDLGKLDDRGCEGAPDLVVEILSPGNSHKEMKEKFEVYEESGVKEYWLVYPEEKYVQVFILDEKKGKYFGIQPFVNGDLMPSHVFPELKIDLQEVFAD